jgi:hypothetical protein
LCARLGRAGTAAQRLQKTRSKAGAGESFTIIATASFSLNLRLRYQLPSFDVARTQNPIVLSSSGRGNLLERTFRPSENKTTVRRELLAGLTIFMTIAYIRGGEPANSFASWNAIKWDDFTDSIPAFLTLIATPLTFGIATGLSLGLFSFTFLKLFSGRRREISPLILGLSVLFLVRYAFLGPE